MTVLGRIANVLLLGLCAATFIAAAPADDAAAAINLGAAKHRSIVTTGNACQTEADSFRIELGKIGRCSSIWAGGCRRYLTNRNRAICRAEFEVRIDGWWHYEFCSNQLRWYQKRGVIWPLPSGRWHCDWIHAGQSPPA
jgi:hypothetical protein